MKLRRIPGLRVAKRTSYNPPGGNRATVELPQYVLLAFQDESFFRSVALLRLTGAEFAAENTLYSNCIQGLDLLQNSLPRIPSSRIDRRESLVQSQSHYRESNRM